MFLLNIKPKNRNRVFLIIALGGLWTIIDRRDTVNIFEFFINGFLFLILTVVLGTITNFFWRKIKSLPALQSEEFTTILDENSSLDQHVQTEDEKDQAALNFGIAWSLLFILLSLF